MSAAPNNWYLYLIECEGGSLYAGISTDVARRYAQHEAGKGARYTRAFKPLRLVDSTLCGTRSAALKAELSLKKIPRDKKIAALQTLGQQARTMTGQTETTVTQTPCHKHSAPSAKSSS